MHILAKWIAVLADRNSIF